MEITIKTLKKRCLEIRESIENQCIDPTGKAEPITDGIIDIDKYFSEKIKILWILKNAYDGPDGTGGGWDYPEEFRANPSKHGRGHTWKPILRASYGILHGFIEYKNFKDLPDDPEIRSTLLRIAFINIEKLANKPRISHNTLKDAYNKNKSILLRQIQTYDPDIIIGGNTLDLFCEDLHLNTLQNMRINDIHLYISAERLYLDAFHPSQTQIKKEKYINDIIGAARKGLEMKRNL